MRAKKARLVIPYVLSIAACSVAQAQTNPPETQFTVGLKAWHSSWLSYQPATYSGVDAAGAPAIGYSMNAVEGNTHTDVLPVISVRHKKVFVSVSHARFSSDFSVQTSPLITSTGQTLITSRTDHFTRRESELNLGYYVTSEVALVIGYKDVSEDRDTRLSITPDSTPLVRTTVKGLLLGAAGSFAINDKLRFYAQAAYGPARLKLKFNNPAFENFKTNGSYLIGEIGLSYPVYTNPSGFGGASLSLGYRTQTAKTKNYANFAAERRELRDVRDGAVLALNYTF